MRFGSLCLCAAIGLAPLAKAQSVPGYLNFADGEKKLAELARQNSSWIQISTIGNSAGNKKLHLLTIAAPGKVKPEQRPAVLIGANLVGFHNAGTQAAVAFVERLAAKKDDAAVKKLLETRTFYVAPMLNPDAHDGLFQAPKYRRSLNVGKLDRDLDGLVGEDGFNDLNNDGKITMMRIADPAGEWIIDEKDPRLMRRADPLKGEKGKFKMMLEGFDDDKDGVFNEDGPGGYRPDRNFAHAWNEADPESGPWPSAQPESKAIMDFLIRHRNVALAVVFGPANNLLEMPRGTGGRGGDVGSLKVTVPRNIANATGLDPAKEYTIDEVFEVVKDSPMARAQGGLTKEALAQILGGGPATAPDAEDLKFYQNFADEYKKVLEKAGLDNKRAGGQSAPGGLQNWLYYQYSAMAVELDVWGVPKKAGATPPARPGAPPAPPATTPDDDTITYIDSSAKDAFVNWTPVTLPDGTKAEVGGVDPFFAITPSEAELKKATEAHADALLFMAGKLAEVAIADVQVKALGSGVYEVSATATNNGFLPTATRLQVRTKSFLPARLVITLPNGAKLVQGNNRVTSERITGSGGTVKGTWLINAAAGSKVTVSILTPNAGEDRREVVLQ